MRLFQAIEAQYAAIRAIQGIYAGDGFGRLVATLCVVVQVMPAVFSLPEEGGGGVFDAASFLSLVIVAVTCLDRRRARLASLYWRPDWVPSMKQRVALGMWIWLLPFGVALTSRISVALALALFVALGSLPLRSWVDRLGRSEP